MLLKCLGSSSYGNCYVLDSGKEALVIEAGIDFKAVKVALDFDIKKIVGVVISHCHL
ncbi:MAG: MBL fold metallo-hydrolase [Acetatifactor sp.]|nr:MBL fold metallo-hydrolase [Acetatifactor sp.]